MGITHLWKLLKDEALVEELHGGGPPADFAALIEAVDGRAVSFGLQEGAY